MKVHSLLKSLNAIDEEMIAEADRFAVKRREQLKSRQHIFVTEVTAVAAIAIAVAGVFFFSLQPGHTPQKQSGQNGVLLDDTQTKTTAKADEEMKTTAEETQELVKIALAPAVYTQDMVEYIKAVSNGTYIQTALLYDENGNDAKSITVLLTLTAGDELSSSR